MEDPLPSLQLPFCTCITAELCVEPYFGHRIERHWFRIANDWEIIKLEYWKQGLHGNRVNLHFNESFKISSIKTDKWTFWHTDTTGLARDPQKYKDNIIKWTTRKWSHKESTTIHQKRWTWQKVCCIGFYGGIWSKEANTWSSKQRSIYLS